MGTKTETIDATTTETTPARPKVKRYRINKRVAREIRDAFDYGRVNVQVHGRNIEYAENQYWLGAVAIGIGSDNLNKYLHVRTEAFKRAYKREMAKMSDAELDAIEAKKRERRKGPVERKVDKLNTQVEQLTVQVEQLNAQLAARGLVEAQG